MGSLAKRLGQLTARSIESESSEILRTIKPNKIPNSLSQRLDTTLKDSHNMRVFGMGTLASMATKERYLRFTHAMYGIYSTMEDQLDLCCPSINPTPHPSTSTSTPPIPPPHPVAHFWTRHSKILRRAPLLQHDILALSPSQPPPSYSPATDRYRTAIRTAGALDRKDGGGRLLGHAYTRYLADLMGGSVLGEPTRLALGLEGDGPRQYRFEFGGDRRGYVEAVYRDLNGAGDVLVEGEEEVGNEERLEEVVAEARAAFGWNVEVYGEEPIGVDSVRGVKNIVVGWLLSKGG